MLCALIILAVVVADQVSKAIVVAKLDMGESTGFIPYILSFCRSENTGMAWGMLKDHRWVFLTLSIVALIGFGILYYKTKKPHLLYTISMAFILGGGVGNMIDRLFRQGVNTTQNAVVDFLKFEFIDFPIFNVADAFITVGTVLIFVYLLFYDKKQEYPLFFDGKKEAKADEQADI